MTNQQYKQKAIFKGIKVELLGPTNSKKISVRYTRPDSETPDKELEVGAFESKLSTETKTFIKSLSEGSECCVTKEKAGNFWILVDVSDVSNAPTKTANNSGYSGSGGNKTPYTSANNKFNPAGQTIGMAIKAGVDWALANKADFSTVGSIARDIMKLSATMEAEYNSGAYRTTTANNTTNTTNTTNLHTTGNVTTPKEETLAAELNNLQF